MAIIKCKMCGGDLNLIPGQSVAECEFCGSRQTVPNQDDEKKLQQFERADWLRRNCEFDKAASVYEAIVSEFRQEAEAYWGLVLCKYGIEYVDDPGTGKKIPTCHRSSFDSVMDDPNLEQALDYADASARKVYREEAKQIERIREGILEVSSKEKPYDIFICYKETDPNGERTLDSVLAQDLYTALTDKGYRVFFSRITLQSKLGEAYEPYIFAALNSAKVMLAIGTDPEYYNAVWVKNEWSRFLKICAADKSKHLIPCYRDLDAYDMPKEFRPLQGVDLGKMGAVQDILFNMEKYIPLKKAAPVVQEQVVVGGSGVNKVANLLDRGNLALEDGAWSKADSFFEDVLNNDSRNAQAYLGKCLALEQCRTIDAFARKRKNASASVKGETLRLKPDTAHIDEIAKKYAVPGYLKEEDLRKLYEFDLSYHSDVSQREQQKQAEERYWSEHKQLSRVEQFATGAVAENVAKEKKALFDELEARIRKAKSEAAAAVADVQKRYAAHIAEADKKAEQMHKTAGDRREADYQSWLEIAKTSSDMEKLSETAKHFDGLGDYKDSRNLAEHCRKRVAEEQAKLDAEAKRQAAKKKKTTILSAIAAAAAVVAIVIWITVISPMLSYNKAMELQAAGQYEEAAAAFEALGDYKDSQTQISETWYIRAMELQAAGQYEEAVMAFGKAGDYKDAAAQSSALWNEIARRDTIAAGYNHTVGLKSDGTVVAVGSNSLDQCDVSGWSDIVAIAAGDDHTVGLKSDGTVVAVGDNDDGQCNVSGWRDIVAIAAGYGHTVGLKSDGTVVAVGDKHRGRCDVSGWRDIVAIAAGSNHTVGLKSDGTVVATKYNGEQKYYYGQCDVSGWRDIVAIAAGGSYTIGLKSDGTVVAVGYNKNGECDVSGWSDIVAIAAGDNHTVGLKSDGTVVAVGDNDYGQCDVRGWSDIVAIAAGDDHTVGLKSDGTVVAVGYNYDGQCDVSKWKNIKLPN